MGKPNPILLFNTGPSGSGKEFVRNNILMQTGLFNFLLSMTTRGLRAGEIDGVHYIKCRESDFNARRGKMCTWLDMEKPLPNGDKWLYGVSESEFMKNIGKNMIYDVNEAKYLKQMWNWVKSRGLNYDMYVLYFVPSVDPSKTISERSAVSESDMSVRLKKVIPSDYADLGINIDFVIRSSADEKIVEMDSNFVIWLNRLAFLNGKNPMKFDDKTKFKITENYTKKYLGK